MKMVGNSIDPSDIGKHIKIIKAAQKELTQADVLVCGQCHAVFHFIELFKEHRENGCEKDSYFRDFNNTKPKLWAFLLWKSSQLNNNSNNLTNHVNSWNLYQQWIRMDDNIRETWIVAGKTILSFTKLGTGMLQEMPVKITKTVVDNNKNSPSMQVQQNANKQTAMSSSLPRQQQQQTAEQSKQSAVQQVIIKKESNNLKNDSNTSSPIKTITTDQPRVTRKVAGTPINQGQIIKQVSTNNPVSTRSINRRTKRTLPNRNDEFGEETIEKIIAKRFNARRKTNEYLVKWEGLPHDQNTWEPQIHLEVCPQLLDLFEKQLARQKEQRAKQQSATNATLQIQQQQAQNISNSVTSNLLSPKEAKTLPTTTVTKIVKSGADQSKKLINDEENTSAAGGTKRKLEDTDLDNNFDDDDIPTHTVKKIRNGAAVTVKTDTKIETKLISQGKSRTVNGSNKTVSPSSDINSISADIVMTKDSLQSSGVYKKSGSNNSTPSKTEAQIRVLSKGDTTTSGVVRINSNTPQQLNNSTTITSTSNAGISGQQKLLTSSNASTILTSLPNTTIQLTNTPTSKTTQQRIGTPTSTSTGQISQVQTHRILMSSKDNQMMKTPAIVQTRIVPKTSPVFVTSSSSGSTTSGGGGLYQQSRTGGITTLQRSSLSPQTNTNQSPTSGKMIIHRNVKSTPASRNVSPAITPEQKIIQLSKSGDLKVTRKVITQPVSQISPQPQQQQQQQINTLTQNYQRHNILQQQQQPQQLRTASISKSESEHSQSPIPADSVNDSQNPSPQFTLCEITGKVIRHGEEQERKSESENHEEKLQQQQQHQQHQQQSGEMIQVQMSSGNHQSNQENETFAAGDLALTTEDGTQFLTNEDGTPLLVTGEDGTIYQVAGKNAEGQTILITQGADGEQLAYVAAAEDGEESGVLAIDNAVAEAVAQMLPKEQAEALAAAGGGETQFIIQQKGDGTGDDAAAATVATVTGTDQTTNDVNQGLSIQTSDTADVQEGNIPAEVVQADLPSPGGTRRVVLLLQDGTFMMTEMHDDEYQALNLVS